jgi:hypothetical protein
MKYIMISERGYDLTMEKVNSAYKKGYDVVSHTTVLIEGAVHYSVIMKRSKNAYGEEIS